MSIAVLLLKILTRTLASVAQLVGVSSYKPKGPGFDSQSGQMPGWAEGLVPSWGLYERQPIDVFL